MFVWDERPSGSKVIARASAATSIIALMSVLALTLIALPSVAADTAPPLTVDSPGEGSYVNEMKVHVKGTTDNAEALAILVESETGEGNVTTVLSPEDEFAVTVELSSGLNRVSVFASYDRLIDLTGHGYSNCSVVTRNVTVDMTPPTVVIDAPAEDPFLTNDPTIELMGRTGDGTAHLVIVHGGVEMNVTEVAGNMTTNATWRYVLELSETDLEPQVTARARDIAGNVAEDSIIVVLDLVPPTLTLDHGASGELVYLLNGSVDDPDIDVIMVNGVLYPVEDGEFSILLSTVHYEIVVSVEDRAGNRAQVRTMMNINPNPPLIGIDEVRRLSEGRYSIEGETRDYVTNVTIDGVRYPVVDGRFSAEVEVDPGTDEVLLVVEDWKGNPWEETVVLEEPTLTGPQLLLVGVVVALAVLVASVAVVRGRKIRRQT